VYGGCTQGVQRVYVRRVYGGCAGDAGVPLLALSLSIAALQFGEPRRFPARQTVVERMRHIKDSQSQILALDFRPKSLKFCKSFLLGSEAAKRE